MFEAANQSAIFLPARGVWTMIFPGMDPYLEHPQYWAGLHSSLIVYFRDQLQPQLRPRYVASIEERVFVEGPDRHIVPDLRIDRTSHPGRVTKSSGATALADEPVLVHAPDAEQRETYIEILDRSAGLQVVTVIELVSPANKFPGIGRNAYLAKQREVRASGASLVEIDLLRTGPHVLAITEPWARAVGEYDYLVCVNRASGMRHDYELYLRTLRDPLPKVRIPLSPPDPDVRLDLQAALENTWESGGYELRIAYGAPCVPALSAEDQAWAET